MTRINALNVALVLAASVLGLLSVALNTNPVLTQDNAVSNSLALYYALGPILGFIGAKEMARFRSFLESRGSVQDVFRVWLRSLALPLLLAVVVVLAYLIVQLADISYVESARSLAMGLAFIALHGVAWLSLGATLGLYLPAIVSIAVGLLLPFILVAYPISLSNVAWRQMFGQSFGSCCQVSQSVDPILWKASALVLGTVCVCSLLLTVAFHGNRLRGLFVRPIRVAAVVLLGVGCGLGYEIAQDGNYDSAVPRPQERMICDRALCYWRETPPDQVGANRKVWETLGVTTYRLIDAEPQRDGDIRLARSGQQSEVKHALLFELLSNEPTLKGAPSCWSTPQDPLSVAEALPDLTEKELERATLTPSGQWRGVHGTNEGVDVKFILDRANSECWGR